MSDSVCGLKYEQDVGKEMVGGGVLDEGGVEFCVAEAE